MRKGKNPYKAKNKLIARYKHRVIIPFFIPNIKEEFYKGTIKTFELCLESLFNTINLKETAVTLINNNSCKEANAIAALYLKKGLITNYIINKENQGKVNPFLDIVKSCKEPIITLSDCDVLFYKGWENAVFNAFNKVQKAGCVSPVPAPHLSLNHVNVKTITSLFFKNKVKFGSVVKKDDFLNLFLSFGKNKKEILKNKFLKKQFFFKNRNDKYIIGATHYIASYRKEVFENKYFKKLNIPEVFYEGIEYFNIDCMIDRLGYYRISTIKPNAYHLGNTIPEFIKERIPLKEKTKRQLPKIKPIKRSFGYLIPTKISILLYALIRKYYYIKFKL